MKRVMAAVLAGVMAFSLTACGGGRQKTPEAVKQQKGKRGKDARSRDGRRRRLRFRANDVALEGLEKAKS